MLPISSLPLPAAGPSQMMKRWDLPDKWFLRANICHSQGTCHQLKNSDVSNQPCIEEDDQEPCVFRLIRRYPVSK
jgi:hypothetical protein